MLKHDVRRFREQVGALLEKHENRRSVAELTSYRDDPVGFIRRELKGEPWSRQVEIAEAVRDTPHVAVRAGNGLGKDWLAARLALWWVYSRGGLVLCTGPTERQVKEVVFGEIRRAFAAAKTLPGELYETALRLDRAEHAGIIGFTGNNASTQTGHHAPAVMVIITEAQGVDSFVYEAAMANTTGEQSRILAVGNPLVPSGHFYQISRSKGWLPIAISAAEHPNVVERREVIPGAVTHGFIDKMAEEYGAGSGIYRARVLGEFPTDSDEVLVKREWLERSAERWDRSAGRLGYLDGSPIFSLDPARFGTDKTALAIRQGRYVHPLVTWAKLSTMETIGQLIHHIRERGFELPQKEGETFRGERDWRHFVRPGLPDTLQEQGQLERAGRAKGRKASIIVDEVGLGGGIVDRLREQGIEVEGFIGGGTPQRDADRLLNRRAEALWRLRKMLEDDAIDLPRDEMLWDELASTKWWVNSSGKVQIEGKDELRQSLGRSPDRADAVAMAVVVRARRNVDLDAYTPVYR